MKLYCECGGKVLISVRGRRKRPLKRDGHTECRRCYRNIRNATRRHRQSPAGNQR